MSISGKMLIGDESTFGNNGEVNAFDPVAGKTIEPAFGVAGPEQINQACVLADEAFDSYRNTAPEVRAAFLEAIADNLLAMGEEFNLRAAAETGLSPRRMHAETVWSAEQMRMFAGVVRQGRWRHATIDSGDLARKPPRHEMRMQKIPLGPVVVFGASNFPVLYSTGGGDTASALAAGCPVVFKAHGSHLGASELVGNAIREAVRSCGLHPGVFSLIIGQGDATGLALVDHPLVKAVTFTGSESGGVALVKRGAARSEPIPVFAEMTSVNPHFLLPSSLATRADEFAAGFVAQMTLGVGQMCLKPGLIVAIDGPGLEVLRDALTTHLSRRSAATMLNPATLQGFQSAVERTRRAAGATTLARGQPTSKQHEAAAEILEIDGADLLAAPESLSEMFGPAGVLVRCTDAEQLVAIAQMLRGQLSMAMHLESADMPLAARLLPILELKANRLLANKFSNQVEISNATIHGGPFPATSDSRFTSVGASAIDRFLRPVCYDNMPTELIPPALRDENPLSLWRLRDGAFVQA